MLAGTCKGVYGTALHLHVGVSVVPERLRVSDSRGDVTSSSKRGFDGGCYEAIRTQSSNGLTGGMDHYIRLGGAPLET